MIWTSEQGGPFQAAPLSEQSFSDVCWKVSWSPMGLLLSVSHGDNKVSVWRQSLDGHWTCTNTLDEKTFQMTSVPSTPMVPAAHTLAT